MTSMIPSYSNPCLASTKDRSIVYLVGSPNTTSSTLNVHIINIANINAPVVAKSFSSVASESASWENYAAPWKHDAPKMCTTFFGTFPAFYDTLFINQIGVNTTWSTVFHPINGTIPRPTKLNDTAFVSKQAYSFVGQTGDTVSILALNNRTETQQPWSFVQWRLSASSTQTDFSILSIPDPLLTVPVFTSGSSAPEKSYFIVFDKLGGGVMLPTIINDVKPAGGAGIFFLNPWSVNMDDITLTADAVYANMGSGVYILVKK
ncbi:hypothetical protein BGZ96_004167 [Linnemannia gamsii]|uniref:Uncharacterized protein n=1 Tax=Linnemannia gamsii TaxID=64522 RepID=A0ABQ7JIH9_9FUNG|nr:hypothetical protein BGZ96_004167 [Linnemannia gamsii]